MAWNSNVDHTITAKNKSSSLCSIYSILNYRHGAVQMGQEMDAYQDFRWNDSIWLLSNYLLNMFVALLMHH